MKKKLVSLLIASLSFSVHNALFCLSATDAKKYASREELALKNAVFNLISQLNHFALDPRVATSTAIRSYLHEPTLPLVFSKPELKALLASIDDLQSGKSQQRGYRSRRLSEKAQAVFKTMQQDVKTINEIGTKKDPNKITTDPKWFQPTYRSPWKLIVLGYFERAQALIKTFAPPIITATAELVAGKAHANAHVQPMNFLDKRKDLFSQYFPQL